MTCPYCMEGELLAKFGIKICELNASKVYLFKEPKALRSFQHIQGFYRKHRCLRVAIYLQPPQSKDIPITVSPTSSIAKYTAVFA